MAAHDRALIIDSLGNGWTDSTAGANVTLTPGVTPAIKGRAHLTQLGWSMKNLTASNATTVMTVRDASIAGTILGQWEIIVAAGVTGHDCWNPNIQGLRGNRLLGTFSTVQASVNYSLSLAGWIDTLGDG